MSAQKLLRKVKVLEKVLASEEPKHKNYVKVWMADCMIKDRDKIIDTRTDEKGRKWSAFLIEEQ